MQTKTYILSIICMGCLFVAAQKTNITTGDSSVFKKATHAFYLASTHPDSAMQLATEALQQAKAIKNADAQANAYNAIGWTYMHKGFHDSAQYFLQQAYQLFNSTGNKIDVIKVSINMAEVYTRQNNIASAIRHLIEADSLSIMVNDTPLQIDIKRQLAIIYRESRDFVKATEYFKQAMAGFLKMEDYSRYFRTAMSLGILYKDNKQYDSSMLILRQCQTITKQKGITPYDLAILDENFAETYFAQNQYSNALTHYSRAYQIFQQLNLKSDMAFEAYCLGKTYSRLQNWPKAEKYLLQSYTINDTLNMLNYKLDAANELANLYEQLGKWKQAFSYLKIASVLQDSLNLTDQINKANELKETFESDKKAQEITLLKTQNQLTAVNYKKARLLQYLFVILLLASISIGLLLYNRLKIKRKLQEQLVRNQIARDLHDDIGSALSSIDINSRIALSQKADIPTIEKQLIKIRQQARQSLEGMQDIVWSVNPQNDNLDSMLARMKEYAAEMAEPRQILLQFKITDNANKAIDSEKRKNIFLIFKEAINNAVKYSDCTKLIISILQVEHTLKLTIEDNGRGFQASTVKQGNGLRNMKERATQLHGDFMLSSGEGQGTVIRVSCPL